MNNNTLKRGLRIISNNDSDIKQGLKNFGHPEFIAQPAGFEALATIIVNQQLSTHAANTILKRVHEKLPEFTPKKLLALRKHTLRTAGLSERKVEYLRGLALAIKNKSFNPDHLEEMEDEAAIQAITNLHGLGIWSAEIYLMFSLGRKDIFPANDLALQVALQKLKNLSQRPTPKIAREIVAHWSPWRSAGSLFLWHFYQHVKK